MPIIMSTQTVNVSQSVTHVKVIKSPDQPLIVKTNTSLLLQSGSSSTNTLKIPFSYGDASPKVLAQITGVIYRAAIVILQPFNGQAFLNLGDSQQSNRLLIADQIDPMTVATYESFPNYEYLTSSQILLSIQLGVGVSQGSGMCFLEFA